MSEQQKGHAFIFKYLAGHWRNGWDCDSYSFMVFMSSNISSREGLEVLYLGQVTDRRSVEQGVFDAFGIESENDRPLPNGETVESVKRYVVDNWGV